TVNGEMALPPHHPPPQPIRRQADLLLLSNDLSSPCLLKLRTLAPGCRIGRIIDRLRTEVRGARIRPMAAAHGRRGKQNVDLHGRAASSTPARASFLPGVL